MCIANHLLSHEPQARAEIAADGDPAAAKKAAPPRGGNHARRRRSKKREVETALRLMRRNRNQTKERAGEFTARAEGPPPDGDEEFTAVRA
jgi:hypothetical protein